MISDALLKHLTASYIREPSTKEKKFYISDMGKCLRMRFFKRKGIETEFAPHVQWILTMGNLLHDFGYKALEAQGLLVEAEDYIETTHYIGRFDGKVKFEDKLAIFDFKSAGEYKMKKIMAGEEDEEAIAQLLTYVMLSIQAGKDVSTTGFVVYINKEPKENRMTGELPQPFVQKEYHLTKWREKKLTEELDTLQEYWMTNKIPACTCVSWMKAYNSYLPICSSSEPKLWEVLKYIENDVKLISNKKGLYIVDGDERKGLIEL